MCGIVGILSKDLINKKDSFLINRMIDEVSYRGPDGKKIIKNNKFITACVRLAIVDPVERSDIPFETKQFIFSFNGEIYNYKILKKKLKKNYKFITESDTEVFARAFEEWGLKCFEKLSGMYACSIYDKKKQKLYLVRDEFGMKPLYYFLKNKKIFFSSEIKSFQHIVKLRLNKNNIKNWLYLNHIEDSSTMIDNCNKVEPGTILIFDKNFKKKKINLYKLEETFKNSNKFNQNKIEQILKKQTEQHTVDIRTQSAVLLSGGLDSSLLAALIKKKYGKQSNNFYSLSCKINFPGLNEEEDIKNVLRQIKIKNYSLNLNKDNFFEHFNRCSKRFDFPIFHPSLVALDMIISQKKMKNSKVLYVGDGSDEIFLGYDWFSPEFYKNLPDISTRGLLDLIGVKSNKFIENSLKIKKQNSNLGFMKKINKLNTESKIRYINQKIYLTKFLFSRDKIGMKRSMEIRVPFCNKEILSEINKINSKHLLDKIILKQIAKKYLKQSNFSRKKIGFTIPIRSWMTKEIIERYLRQINFKCIKYYNHTFIKKILNEHYSGEVDHIRFIWNIISFELWAKHYFKK